MSGYVPLLFQTSPIYNENGETFKRVINLLSLKYSLNYTFPKHISIVEVRQYTNKINFTAITEENQNIDVVIKKYRYLRISGSINIGNAYVFIDIICIPSNSEHGKVIIKIEIDEMLFDSIYKFDYSKHSIDKKQKSKVIEFCTDIAEAAAAEAFIFQIHQKDTSQITTYEILELFESSPNDIQGLLYGVSIDRRCDKIKENYIYNKFLIIDNIT